MLNLNKLSPENLGRMQKVLKIILDTIELQETDKLVGNKILLKRFEQENLYYDDIIGVLNRINKEGKIVKILNEFIKKDVVEFHRKLWVFNTEGEQRKTTEKETQEYKKIHLKTYGVSEEDLKNYVILKIKDLNKVKEIQKEIVKKLKEIAQTRVKAMGKHLEESGESQKEIGDFKKEIIEETNKKLGEQRRVFEKLGKQISSWVPRDSISAFKQYEELSKKLTKQLTPLKSTLEEVGKLQSTIEHAKSFLNPALQRLATPIKQMEEAMKTLKEYNRIETPNAETLIPSDIKRAKQEAETLSELREIRTVLQGFLTEKTKKNAVKGVQGKIPTIGKIEIIGRDKIEQHGNKNTTKIKNIASNHPSKKWFSPNNFSVWIIGTIIITVIAGLILNWLLR